MQQLKEIAMTKKEATNLFVDWYLTVKHPSSKTGPYQNPAQAEDNKDGSEEAQQEPETVQLSVST